jgi:hypothetical protein
MPEEKTLMDLPFPSDFPFPLESELVTAATARRDKPENPDCNPG